MSDRMVGADDGIMVGRVVSHKGQSDLLKPNTSLWLRCMKTRQSMTISFGPLNWLNKTHHEQPWISCLLPPHLWMNDTSITSNIHIHKRPEDGKGKAVVLEPSPFPFLQRISYYPTPKTFK